MWALKTDEEKAEIARTAKYIPAELRDGMRTRRNPSGEAASAVRATLRQSSASLSTSAYGIGSEKQPIVEAALDKHIRAAEAYSLQPGQFSGGLKTASEASSKFMTDSFKQCSIQHVAIKEEPTWNDKEVAKHRRRMKP